MKFNHLNEVNAWSKLHAISRVWGSQQLKYVLDFNKSDTCAVACAKISSPTLHYVLSQSNGLKLQQSVLAQ